MKTRKEHIEWCKQRANECIDRNDIEESFASFQSDMTKHNETSNHSAMQLGIMLLLSGHLSTKKQMREWVNGFN